MGTDPRATNNGHRLAWLGRTLILALCAAALVTSLYPPVTAQAPAAVPEPAAKAGYTLTAPPTYASAIEKVMPSVVFIYTEKTRLSGNKPVFEGGSGVILRSDGYILTNRHVVEDAKKVWVTLYDRSTYEAVSVFPATLMDLAVVKINAGGLPAATVGDSDKLRMGDQVVALGNPLGLSSADGIGSATTGIVSKRDCSFVMEGVPYYDMIQTDAAINTGNSGGPLVNLDGQVIGINSAHALFAQNVGFAISMNTARHVFDDLATLGKSSHPYLGITAEDMQAQITGSTIGTQRRAIITNVEAGAPSAAAGLKVKDVVLGINDREVHSLSELTRILWRMNSGDAIKITVLRNGETLSLNVRLSIRPDTKPLAEL
jgi:serine protease Do